MIQPQYSKMFLWKGQKFSQNKIWWSIWETERFGPYPGDSRIIWESWHRCKCPIIVCLIWPNLLHVCTWQCSALLKKILIVGHPRSRATCKCIWTCIVTEHFLSWSYMKRIRFFVIHCTCKKWKTWCWFSWVFSLKRSMAAAFAIPFRGDNVLF